MAIRPQAVAFDVIETLMPLEPLRERFTAIGLPPHLLELWFTRTLRDGIALAATGDYAPFSEVAVQALRIVSRYQADDTSIAHVLAGLPAHPDVLPAARMLAAAGVRLACLTNGSVSLIASAAGHRRPPARPPSATPGVAPRGPGVLPAARQEDLVEPVQQLAQRVPGRDGLAGLLGLTPG